MRTSYYPFIDWLKCLGMAVIVYGHVAAWGVLATLPPINTKQLGVAFFLFSAGYCFARETRDPWQVAFNRLFEVYLFGVALALLLSVVTYFTIGRLQLSNYYPFFAGANVLLDYFPANPTTWYLGTYLHVVVLWVFLRDRLRVGAPLLALIFVVEIVARAAIMQVGRYTAYMVLFNWSTVLLLGYWYGERNVKGTRLSMLGSLPALGLLAVGVVGWSVASRLLPFEMEFPFMRLRAGVPILGEMTVSALVSILYVAGTWMTFSVVAPLPAPRFVRFIARNTLIIFLAHMPVVYALRPMLMDYLQSRVLCSLVLAVIALPGLALASEAVRGLVRPGALRDRLYASLRVRIAGSTLALSSE